VSGFIRRVNRDPEVAKGGWMQTQFTPSHMTLRPRVAHFVVAQSDDSVLGA
jgi:hypothetical protein